MHPLDVRCIPLPSTALRSRSWPVVRSINLATNDPMWLRYSLALLRAAPRMATRTIAPRLSLSSFQPQTDHSTGGSQNSALRLRVRACIKRADASCHSIRHPSDLLGHLIASNLVHAVRLGVLFVLAVGHLGAPREFARRGCECRIRLGRGVAS
jgi:hypothetical protein